MRAYNHSSGDREDVAAELDIFDRIVQLIPDFLNLLKECAEHRTAIHYLFKYVSWLWHFVFVFWLAHLFDSLITKQEWHDLTTLNH